MKNQDSFFLKITRLKEDLYIFEMKKWLNSDFPDDFSKKVFFVRMLD